MGNGLFAGPRPDACNLCKGRCQGGGYDNSWARTNCCNMFVHNACFNNTQAMLIACPFCLRRFSNTPRITFTIDVARYWAGSNLMAWSSGGDCAELMEIISDRFDLYDEVRKVWSKEDSIKHMLNGVTDQQPSRDKASTFAKVINDYMEKRTLLPALDLAMCTEFDLIWPLLDVFEDRSLVQRIVARALYDRNRRQQISETVTANIRNNNQISCPSCSEIYKDIELNKCVNCHQFVCQFTCANAICYTCNICICHRCLPRPEPKYKMVRVEDSWDGSHEEEKTDSEDDYDDRYNKYQEDIESYNGNCPCFSNCSFCKARTKSKHCTKCFKVNCGECDWPTEHWRCKHCDYSLTCSRKSYVGDDLKNPICDKCIEKPRDYSKPESK